VQDNFFATWQSFNNRFWPAKYLIDSEGYIRYSHFGEGKYEETELMIQKLLEEAGQKVDMATTEEKEEKSYLPRTPELYAGYKFALPRGQDIGDGLKVDESVEYTLPKSLSKHKIYLEGNWLSNADDLVLSGEGKIVLRYQGTEVNIVADGNSEMGVLLDDKIISSEMAGKDVAKGLVKVTEPTLYNVVKGDHGTHTLTLVVKEPYSFNAFTFG